MADAANWRGCRYAIAGVLLLAATSCSDDTARPSGPEHSTFWFEEIGSQVGLDFAHRSGHDGRRHLLPEYMSENLDAHRVDGEIHQSEAVEEKISLSERFGLWISFYPFKQDQYLEIAFYWLEAFDALPEDTEEARQAALQWALVRGSRSGRSAYQFALDWAGKNRLAD